MTLKLARFFAGTLLAAAVSTAWAQASSDDIRFDISRFEVKGNTLLPAAEVERLVGPYTGQRRDFGDVQRALEALEAAYHARGYNVVTVELPEQELNQGVVLLKVMETKIGRVKVENNRYFDEANIRRSLPALQEGRTPNLNEVSNSLRLANENPSKKVNLKLQSSETDGEVDARLEVTDENAWKGIPIRINVDETRGRLILSVRNTGTPIPAEQHNRIFGYLRRESGADKAGWGIGLPFVRAVAESHGGSAAVDSSAATGTTFLIDVPVDSALRDVLSRTRKYKDAVHAGFDPDPHATRLTPNVALVSRLPLAAPPQVYAEFPQGVVSDSGNPDSDRFARAPLHAQVVLRNETVVDVVVVHLKSRRPDYRRDDCGEDPLHFALANLRSLVWRGTEAVALRVLLSKVMKDGKRPCIVMGDFNDTADAVTTTIVLGANPGLSAFCEPGEALRGRMFDCAQIQLRQDHLRQLRYSQCVGQVMSEGIKLRGLEEIEPLTAGSAVFESSVRSTPHSFNLSVSFGGIFVNASRSVLKCVRSAMPSSGGLNRSGGIA
eukprot:gene25049-31459_t